MNVEIRASDEDRQRTIAALQRHTEAGRLGLDEFSDRAGAVYAARTLGELAAVTRDLPADPATTGGPGTAGSDRQVLALFAIAAVTLLLLVVFMAVTRGH